MSKVKRYPAMLHSEDGECRTFDSADDVPSEGGWGPFPPNHPRRGEEMPEPVSKGQKPRSSIKEWPAWCVDKDGNEAIYESAKDMPKGWATKQSLLDGAKKPAAKKDVDERTAGIDDKSAEEVIMTKAEAMEALAENNIEFDAKSKKLELVKLILWAIDEGKIEAE